MRNARNGFVKNLRYLCLIGVIALGLMTIIGSTGGGGGGSPISPPTAGSLKILNDMSTSITEVYFSPTSSTSWGSNQLSGIISPGGEWTFSDITPDDYDLKVGFSDDSTYIHDEAISITAGQTTTMTITFLTKTELLKGYWDFYYAMPLLYSHRARYIHYYYTLDNLTDDTNDQGGYYILGTDEYDDPVNACYWPDDEYWTLLDESTTIDRFYVFYTDGSTILENSCYYQINNSTDDWSSCYTLYGDKGPLSTAQVKASLMEAIEAEERGAIEGEEETLDDSIEEKYWQLKQAIDSQK